MNHTLRIAAALITIVTMLVVLPEDARACSCAAASPYEHLERADAAFVGELISRPDEGTPDDRGLIEGDYIFQVHRVVKGDLPETINVRSPLDGASCGFEGTVGQRVGVALRWVDGHWSAGLCDQVDPDALLAAAGPLPTPEAGEIIALAGMTTEKGRTVALDSDGSILAYGAGQGELARFEVCPGSRTVIEHSWVRGEDGVTVASILGARDLGGFHVLHEIAGPQVPSLVADMACMDPAGEEVLLLAPGQILRATSVGLVEVAELEAQAGCPGGGTFDPGALTAYFTGGANCRGLYRYDLETGDSSEIGRVPDDSGIDALTAMALSPDGRYLAIEAHPGPEPLTFKVLIFDLTADPASNIDATFGGPFEPHTLLWLANDRLLLTGTTESLDEGLILTPQLDQVGSINGIWGGSGGVRGDQAYILEPYGRLLAAPIGGGMARILRTFDDPTVHALAVLPVAVQFDPISAIPDNLAELTPPTIDTKPASRDGHDGTTAGYLTAGGILLLLAGTLAVLLASTRHNRKGMTN